MPTDDDLFSYDPPTGPDHVHNPDPIYQPRSRPRRAWAWVAGGAVAVVAAVTAAAVFVNRGDDKSKQATTLPTTGDTRIGAATPAATPTLTPTVTPSVLSTSSEISIPTPTATTMQPPHAITAQTVRAIPVKVPLDSSKLSGVTLSLTGHIPATPAGKAAKVALDLAWTTYEGYGNVPGEERGKVLPAWQDAPATLGEVDVVQNGAVVKRVIFSGHTSTDKAGHDETKVIMPVKPGNYEVDVYMVDGMDGTVISPPAVIDLGL